MLEKAECEALGMGSFLGVSEASDEPPKFIHLTYTPRENSAAAKKVAVVGKGLTFDSGGYNIKTGAGWGALRHPTQACHVIRSPRHLKLLWNPRFASYVVSCNMIIRLTLLAPLSSPG